MPLVENVAAFQDLMRTCSSMESVFVDPVKGMGENQHIKVWDFPTTMAQTVASFVTSGIFQHYRMFQLLFHGTREVRQLRHPCWPFLTHLSALYHPMRAG